MKIFKNEFFKRSAVLLIAVLMMLASCMPVFADDDEELVSWFLSEDETTLEGNGKVYKQFDHSRFDAHIDPRAMYCFEDDTWLGDVYATSKDSEIVFIKDYGIYEGVYVTEEGMKLLADFAKGQNAEFLFEMDEYRTDILDSALVYAMDAESKASLVQLFEVKVEELEDALRYDVVAYDPTHTFARVYGAIYQIDGGYYYVNYSTLEPNYFDANGNFSYNPGPKERKVPLVKLGDSTLGAVATALEGLRRYEVQYTYEEEDDFDLTKEFGMGVFWVSYSLIGFIAPIPFIVIGAVFANSQKRGKKKRWYIISAIALLYLILAIVTAILLAI